MSKKKPKPVSRPDRDPDHYSKRGVPYWWAPEWVRGTSADMVLAPSDNKDGIQDYYKDKAIRNSNGDFVVPQGSYGRIKAIKDSNGEVTLHMWSKDGDLKYIQGSIQQEFHKWHTDRLIDYTLLGEDPDTILDSEND